MDTLSDFELRKMLVEHGVHDGPVTPTTRHVLQNKLSKVMSQHNGGRYEQMDTYSDTYTVEEVMNTAACLVTEDAPTEPHQAPEVFQTYTEIHDTPVYEHSEADLIREDSEAYTSRSYEYTPTSQTLRYARDSYPSADNLRRRPLNTQKAPVVEHTSSVKVEKTHASSTCSTKSGETCKKKSWICSRIFIILLLLVICFVVLVYYHMDPNEIQFIPAAETPATDDKPPVGKQPSR